MLLTYNQDPLGRREGFVFESREVAGVPPAGYAPRGKRGKRVPRGVASAWHKRNPLDHLDHLDHLYPSAIAGAPKERNLLPPSQHNPISCQSGANLALTRVRADGTYYAYFPFALTTEASK